MKNSKKSPVRLAALLFFVVFFAHGNTPQGDTPYLQSPVTDKLEIIISESYKKESPFIRQYSRQFHEEYKSLFSNKLPSSKNFLIFISPKKQMLNGNVKVFPLPLVHIYSNSHHVINTATIHNWLQDSLSHEMAHLYQLNSQGRLSSWLSFLPAFFWFIYPNIYLNRLILEGNAVLFESLYGTGGRLFSGEARAFVFSQIKNKVSLKRLFNDYNDTFSRKEKYLHGGYFFAYLMENYSLEHINQIFSNHRKHILFPIGIQSIDRTFYKTFGKNFQSLFKKYKKFYLPEAVNQKSSPDPILLTSGISTPLNSDNKWIYFLTSEGKTTPRLVVLNKKTLKLSRKKRDMPLGKVFFLKKTFYSIGTAHTKTMVSETSLFKDGYIPLKKYNSRYVMDIKGNTTLSLHTNKGPIGFPLYVNNSFYDYIQSTALMDDQKNIYYFKQNKNIRTLYYNKTPLWSFEGYYSFPVDADKEGVYFVGPTKYGSSLFAYKNGQVLRLSPSDTIVSGRKINDSQFLVSEVGPYNYSYKIITLSEREETPYLYTYNFEKLSYFHFSPGDIPRIKKGLSLSQKEKLQIETPLIDFPEPMEDENLIADLNAEVSANSEDSTPENEKIPTPDLDINLSAEPTNPISENKKEDSKDLIPEPEDLQDKNSLTDNFSEPSFRKSLNESSLTQPFHYYNPLTNIKFQHLFLMPLFTLNPPALKSTYFQMDFIDPLQWNVFSLMGNLGYSKKAGGLRYDFKRYRTSVGMEYHFKDDPLINIKRKQFDRINDIKTLESEKLYNLVRDAILQKKNFQISSYRASWFNLSLAYPVFKRENWKISLLSLLSLGKERFSLLVPKPISNKKKEPPQKPTKHILNHSSLFLNHKGEIQFYYNKKYPQAFASHKNLDWSLYYNSIYLETSRRAYFSFGSRLSFEKALGREWYFSGMGEWNRHLKNSLLNRSFRKKEKGLGLNFHSFTTVREEAKGFYQTNLTLKKAFNSPLYFLNFPLALKRTIPLTGVSLFAFETTPWTVSRYFVNVYLGKELEFSLNHQANALTGMSLGYIHELKNFWKTKDHGLHGSFYLKVVF